MDVGHAAVEDAAAQVSVLYTTRSLCAALLCLVLYALLSRSTPGCVPGQNADSLFHDIRSGFLAAAAAGSVAALLIVALVPRGVWESRTELVPVPHNSLPDDTSGSTPFVLAGSGSNTILKELSYNHAADRSGGHQYIRRGGARGRLARRAPGRAQKLDELDPDDPAYGKYEWRDPASLEQEENTFDTDEFDSTPHEWKGAGEPEENVMDYEGSTEWPDEPSEGTYQWRDPASLEQEENTFDTDEYDSTPHEWKGAGEPEENVFENIDDESGAKKEQSSAKQAALARIQSKAGQQAKQRAQARKEAAHDTAGERQVEREQQKLKRARQQKSALAQKLEKRDQQLASVTKQLLAERSRVAQVEKEAQGHIWRRQHSPVNVLKTVYPQIKWKWHKNVEHLPSAIFDNLKSKPVLWHKYRPTPSHVLDYLSTKPVEWHAQKESYNALEGLPVTDHEWHKQPGEVNVLNSLPDQTHQWRR